MNNIKEYATPVNECSHDYNKIEFYEDDPRTEWADRFGICPDCGADVTYRINYERDGSTKVELHDVYSD